MPFRTKGNQSNDPTSSAKGACRDLMGSEQGGKRIPLVHASMAAAPCGGSRTARTSRQCPRPAFPRLLLSKCCEDSLRDSEHPWVFREKGTRGHRGSPMPNSGSTLACDDIHSSKTIVFTPNPLACSISPVL